MEALIQDINHGFLYTHRGQLQTEICQVHNYNDETDNDWRHKTRQQLETGILLQYSLVCSVYAYNFDDLYQK